MIKDVGEEDFEAAVLKSDRPIVIDFWAPWCGPCKALAPTLADVANDYADVVDIVKIDIDASPSLAGRYGVQSIPLLIIVKNGEEVARQLGGLSRSRIEAFIDFHCGIET